MTDTFIACTLTSSDASIRELTAHDLRRECARPALILNTCQRLEAFGRQGFDIPHPDSVCETSVELHLVRRLARIAAGLESRILGELEILGQVRQAYKEFHLRFGKDDPKLDRLFQDALSLARKARRISGIDRNLTGLAALTARRIIGHVPADAPVTIIGAGSVAKGVARYLGKRSKLTVRISSRCPENAMRLAAEIGAFSSGLDELAHTLCDARVIVTATAAPHPILYSAHVPHLATPQLIIDLGEPPDCDPALRMRPDIEYVSLLEIESLAQTNTDERRDRAKVAARIIDEATGFALCCI